MLGARHCSLLLERCVWSMEVRYMGRWKSVMVVTWHEVERSAWRFVYSVFYVFLYWSSEWFKRKEHEPRTYVTLSLAHKWNLAVLTLRKMAENVTNRLLYCKEFRSQHCSLTWEAQGCATRSWSFTPSTDGSTSPMRWNPFNAPCISFGLLLASAFCGFPTKNSWMKS